VDFVYKCHTQQRISGLALTWRSVVEWEDDAKKGTVAMEIRDDLIFAALARRHVANGELQSLCEAMHLTHAALARAVLVDPAHVGRWMRGEALPTGARAVRLGALIAGWLVVRDGSFTLTDETVATGELAGV